MSAQTELKPCPFCGTIPINHGYRIDCENCGAGLSVVDTFHDDKTKAHERLLSKWNTRPLESEAFNAALDEAAKQVCIGCAEGWAVKETSMGRIHFHNGEHSVCSPEAQLILKLKR